MQTEHAGHCKTSSAPFQILAELAPILALWPCSLTPAAERATSAILTTSSAAGTAAGGAQLVAFSLKAALKLRFFVLSCL